jgi:dienelactone hydrolase/ribosomal protein L18E
VQAGNSIQIDASANNDPSGAGVSWSMSPATGAGSLSNASNTSVTYNAPATPAAADQTVTVTATSLTDGAKSAAVTITVPSVTISVTAPATTVQATGTVSNIVATVGHDPTNKGVNWSVTCSPAPCGSVSPTATASGVATTYTAPPTPPASDLQVTITATSVADPVASASVTITVAAISVSVTAPASTVQAGGTLANIIATVNNDPFNKGVTWSINPCGASQCGSLSANSSASGAAITYTAPTTPPPSDLLITIVATSVSDTSQQSGLDITVLAINVSVAPVSAIIPVNADPQLNATSFTATVNNDPSSKGTSWTLTQGTTPCSPTCGTITPAITTGCTPSCTPTVYSAPAAVPANPSVTLTATSVADGTKLASASITLVPGTVKLIPASLKFGALNLKFAKARTLTLSLTNSGSAPLGITSKAITGTNPGAFSITSDQCPSTVASGASCDMSVTFRPPSTGLFSATLSIADNDVSSPQLVPMSGSGCSATRCFGQTAIQAALMKNRTVAVPPPTGSNKVGTRVIELVDASRLDPYIGSGAKREVLVRFWYPTALTQHCKPAQYASADVWNYLGQLERVTLPQVRTNSCQDAVVATGVHPVVVFTHGYTGTLTDYTFLFEDLASRGYVVASVSHTFESTAVHLPDGRLLKSRVGSHVGGTMRTDVPTISRAVTVRLTDLRFVMDELERLNVSKGSPFLGALDASRVVVAGHSLGGMTALLAAQLDPRFRAAISLDGVMPGPLFGTTETPALLLLAGRTSWDQETCRLWQGLHGPRVALNLIDAEHLTFSDAVWLAPGAIRTGTVGRDKTVAAVRNYVAAFLDANLNGRPMDRLLTGESPDSPDVKVWTQTQSQCSVKKSGVQ